MLRETSPARRPRYRRGDDVGGAKIVPRIVLALGGIRVAWTLRVLGATWQLRIGPGHPVSRGEAFVGAVWHRGLFIAAYAFRDRGAGGGDCRLPVPLLR